MEKLKNIEFLRIIGCIAIIFLHLFSAEHLFTLFPDIDIYRKLYSMTYNGQKAVDLFFILSGFFFILTTNIKESSFIDFIKKKIIRFYPVLIFLMFITFVISLFGILKFDLYTNILTLFGLNGTGLTLEQSGNIGRFWYVSAMLWVMLLFYYLLKNFDKKYVNLSIGLMIYFSYLFILNAKGGRISGPTTTYAYIFNIGMLRAVAGIGIGYFIGNWYKSNIDTIRNICLSLKQQIFISVVELLCLFFIINNLLLHKIKYKNNIIFILVFTLTIVLFLIRKGFFSKLLDKDIWLKLSKYTYSFYMSHLTVINILHATVWKTHSYQIYEHPLINIFVTLFLILAFGLITYHFVEKPAVLYFSQLRKK